MAGKFVLKKSSNGKYHFNLVATNGQVIASSEMYERKASALNGIESVQKNAPGAEVDDQTGSSQRFSRRSGRDARWPGGADFVRGQPLACMQASKPLAIPFLGPAGLHGSK